MKTSGALARKAQQASIHYGAHGLPYTAVGVDWWKLTNVQLPAYRLSVRQGRNMLREYIRAAVRDCPAMKLVLVGYSQGAHVVGDVLSKGIGGLSGHEMSHVAGVALIADPRFNSREPFSVGTFRVGRNGLLGARTPGDLDAVKGRVRAWCRKDDIVCQGPGTPSNHAQDRYWTDHGSAIVAFLAARAFPTQTTSPVLLPDCGISTYGGEPSPRQWDRGCTGVFDLNEMRWRDWGKPIAVGTGITVLRECKPDCASGKVFRYPVEAHVSNIRPCKGKNGRAARFYTRIRMIVTLPADNPLGLPGGKRSDVYDLGCVLGTVGTVADRWVLSVNEAGDRFRAGPWQSAQRGPGVTPAGLIAAFGRSTSCSGSLDSQGAFNDWVETWAPIGMRAYYAALGLPQGPRVDVCSGARWPLIDHLDFSDSRWRTDRGLSVGDSLARMRVGCANSISLQIHGSADPRPMSSFTPRPPWN